MKVFRFGDMYVYSISIYENEINTQFTNKIEEARRFELDEVIIYDNIFRALFHFEFELVDYIEVKE